MPANSNMLLDALDRAILYQLDLNARQPSAAIARSAGVPEETVRHRIRRLVDRKVITGTLTVIDAGKLGNNYFKILVKLERPTIEVIEEFEEFLLAKEEVNWAARLDVLYDLGFTVRVRQLAELSRFIDGLKARFHGNIRELQIAVNIEVDFLPRDYLMQPVRQIKRKTAYTTPLKAAEIDELDIALLRLLSRNARASLAELSNQAGCSPETAAKRITYLEQQAVITAYRLVLNCEAAGMLNYYVFLFLNSASPKRILELTAYCRQSAFLSYFIKALGPWDYELNIEAPDRNDYREFMSGLCASFSGLIRQWIGIPVNRVHRLTIAP